MEKTDEQFISRRKPFFLAGILLIVILGFGGAILSSQNEALDHCLRLVDLKKQEKDRELTLCRIFDGQSEEVCVAQLKQECYERYSR